MVQLNGVYGAACAVMLLAVRLALKYATRLVVVSASTKVLVVSQGTVSEDDISGSITALMPR